MNGRWRCVAARAGAGAFHHRREEGEMEVEEEGILVISHEKTEPNAKETINMESVPFFQATRNLLVRCYGHISFF
jgi:hypothetical protein